MGPVENQPDRINPDQQGAADRNIQEINAELERLKTNVIRQLSQEIEQLQARKKALLQETEQLESRRQQQQQQQQDLVQQIAPALAQKLHHLLTQQLANAASPQPPAVSSVDRLNDYNENAYRAIASLDSTLRTTFRTLQQDLSSYQSSLSQQLGQMYSLEQQGTAILDALVTRLKVELEAKMAESVPTPPPAANVVPPAPPPPRRQPPTQAIPVTPPPPPPPKVTKKRPKPSQVKLGFILILLYSLTLSLQNVVTRVIVMPKPSAILGGVFNLGSYIAPTLGNSVLLLMLRMFVVVFVMLILAGFLYPRTWQDIQQFIRSQNTNLWLKVIGSGFFLFLSQVLIYIAFGLLSAGVTITIFFIFPIVTVLLSWLLFGERPSGIRLIATAVVFLGVAIIALFGGGVASSISFAGVAIAALAGIAFALYVLLIQAGAKAIHPIPLSVINFATILVFSVVSFLLPFIQSSVEIDPNLTLEIWMCGLILGGLSLFSYLVNNIGISLIGAARASIFGATGPVFTALLTFFLVGEALNGAEIFGMLIVTAGVAAVSAERLLKKPSKPVSKPKKAR
jgi:drug/metabolite transporter (DMT)-like permease